MVGALAGVLFGAAHAADGTSGQTLFCLGTPDGSSLEFGLTVERWPAYLKRYPHPIVFTVGKSRLKAWPYIHPGTNDTWAGGKAHTFTICFRVDSVPAAPLYLIVGQLDAHEGPEMIAAVNGQTIGRQRVPAGTGTVANNPSEEGRPAAMIFAVPLDAVRPGENSVALTLTGGSWLVYDYVCLGTASKPPKFPPPNDDWAKELLAGPASHIDEMIFATRTHISEHWYANFGYFSPAGEHKAYGKGGRLCRLSLKTDKLALLIDDLEGAVRDPCVHYDAQRIVFSYRKGGTETYHLYEIGADGSNLRQLTDGVYDDIEPCYLPDGGIVIVSARARRWVNCWLTQVATLHRCDADGRNIRQLSANVEHDNTPWVLPDGRILYMRWEYVDRSQVNYHHLWTMNPDGTGQMVYFGNLHPGGVFIDAKPIPGDGQVVLIHSPGHGAPEHAGYVATVNVKQGPDYLPAMRNVSRIPGFRDPWAVAEDVFLVAQDHRLVLMDGRGRTFTLYALPPEFKGVGLHEPRPLMKRPREPVVPSQADLSQPTGRYLLSDVSLGRNMNGIRPGEIKKLLVLESLPKPVNFTGGMDPLSYSGTFTLERVLGTVPVEEDGSAFFEVPATRSLLFVALDENDRAVKRMQSFTTVGPGETLGCVGCHEHRTQTTPAWAPTLPLAARRGARPIEPLAGAPDVPDFPRDIQPILDRHCLKCHDYDKRDGATILTGDRGPMFSHSYFTLVVRKQVADGRNYARSNYPPRALGSGGSSLMDKLDPAHHDVRVSPSERQTVRLWLDAGAPYPGTYAALGTGMIGGYQANAEVLENDQRWPETRAAQAVFARRCATCHTDRQRPIPKTLSDEIGLSFWSPSMSDPRLLSSRHLAFNLTRPEKSLILLAPLARTAGGYGLCRPAGAPVKTDGQVLASRDDPDYRTLLAMCEAGARRLNEIKRFDMPGFRPRPEYVREMIRYGVLPKSFDPATDPIDVYAVDRTYWGLFEWKPPARQ